MIRVERLSKSYGRAHALTEVTFEAVRGEAVAIAGAIGSGRSTLLRILATLVAPTSGRLDIDGIDAIARPFDVRRKLFWAGTPALASEMSVTEYLGLASAGRGRHRLDPARRRAVLARAGVTSGEIPLADVAGSQRRLVDLAAAVLSEAEILLIDEPFGGTTAPDREACVSLLAEARGRGATMVLTTTAGADLPRFCDRVLSLEGGRAVSDHGMSARPPAAPAAMRA